MKRLLGLDYGDTTIGVAVSDALGLYAHDVEVIRRQHGRDFKKPLARLGELVARYDAEAFVLGYPKHMDGSEGVRCQITLEFKDRLERTFHLPIYLWDERLTTAEANRHITLRTRQRIVDKVAAVFILQGYLDFIRKGGVAMNIEDNNEMEWDGEDEEFEVITVTSEDGSQSDYAVVDYATDGDVNYLLLLPMDEDEEDEDEEAQEAIIVKEIQTEGDEVVYESINDEAELERVMALFDDEERGYELH